MCGYGGGVGGYLLFMVGIKVLKVGLELLVEAL